MLRIRRVQDALPVDKRIDQHKQKNDSELNQAVQRVSRAEVGSGQDMIAFRQRLSEVITEAISQPKVEERDKCGDGGQR